MEEHENVVVLTVDELEALWNVAHRNGEIEGLQNIEYMLGTQTISFATYVGLKGIVLNNDTI